MDLSLYELYKTEILSKVTLVLDIGVSDGVFLNRSAKYFSGNPRRIGIDPVTYKDFDRWSAIEFYEFAVSSKCGEVGYFVSEDKVGSSINNTFGNKRVPSKRIDCFFEEIQIQRFENIFVKLDTQGSEIDCLKSLGPYLEDVSAIHVESWLKPFGGAGKYFANTIQELDELGFFVCEIIDPLRRLKDSKLGQIDLLCLRKNSKLYYDLEW